MVLDEMCASEYLNQLLQDKTTVSKMPKIFLHSERLLDEEINKVRNDIFSPSSFLMSLPKPQGPVVKLTEKVYAKVKEYPKFNFVGRIIGPRGLTLRQVEQETGCKLLVRGRGSMKDKKMEEEKIGQPNYEHLQEDLHVLIMVEDTDERARLKLQKAREEVSFLMVPPKDGEDDIKKKQLQDLAILNGTYRPHHDQMPPNAVGSASTLIEDLSKTTTWDQSMVNLADSVALQVNEPNIFSPPSLQNGLINFPSPTPMMQPNPAQQAAAAAAQQVASAAQFPGMPRATNSVSTALQSIYPLEHAYGTAHQTRTQATSFLDFSNFDPVSLLTGKR